MKTSLKKELLKARANGYAVPAFNFDNLEMAKGIIEAAEETRSPVILMVTESAAKYMGLDYVFALGKVFVQSSHIPVVLHWDHGFDIELIKKACENEFTSVMLDASKSSFEDNVKMTQEVVGYAKKFGVEVESEIGHVGGKEDDRESNENGFTDLNEAVEFNHLTKIDALAIAVGTAHGIYSGKIELQFDLIEKINKSIDTPLVLHGSSGVPLKDLQKAIKSGICKINIGTDLKQANAFALKKWLIENNNGYDARKFGRAAIEAVKLEAIKKIIAFGSDGKA
ncbi:fructose/tagatose bisphosphate aldolase, class II [Spiroplasma sabaudiense Ar-1343]|uniref:Fructose/tagatose bisphosphate aldolase, class II n=1 Tax=Spiroplasma sabaudiense Ar-1343 TaxID=1276257 RepID=W6A9R5_9MOLU|nr:class II fructose-bisphosphate aldolase [Spiroplasma sabaudiense]AHI53762.1 fructose/tagatose bisphosphate aldolase, class II [Spiroplasma sabaudiense Ar-1343]